MELFTLIVVIVSQVYVCVQTHQIIYIKYVQFLVYQLYLNITGEERKAKSSKNSDL